MACLSEEGQRVVKIPLCYGRESLELDVQDRRVVKVFSGPAAPELPDLSAAVSAALASPLDFPPLHRSVVPGDRVVVVTDPRLANPDRWLAPILAELVRGGVEPSAITVLEAALLSGASA